MKKHTNFQDYLETRVREGDRSAGRFLKEGKNPMVLAIEEAKRRGLSQDLIEKVEEKGIIDGSFEITYEGAERIYRNVEEIIRKAKNNSKPIGSFNIDYMDLINRLDPIKDSDLIATSLFCLVPEVRDKLKNNLDTLYRIVFNVASGKRKGYSLPQYNHSGPSSDNGFFPQLLKEVLSALPSPESDDERDYHRRLHMIVQKKAERDVFHIFKHDSEKALKTLEDLASQESNENLALAYKTLADTYKAYLKFELAEVNHNFLDPNTGERGVLPSLHQKIGAYNLFHKKRFGIWNGGGTGKTAIPIITQPLIERELERKGGKFNRAIIICPNSGKKAWKTGLIGENHERYLKDKQDLIVIDGDKKDEDFMHKLKDHKWIVMNYNQLVTQVNGGEEIFLEHLMGMGVDLVVYDESRHIKGIKTSTKIGNPTHSAAARGLALISPYFSPLCATPISNGLEDFANQYHLLNPEKCSDPKKFMDSISHSPRVLYTFFHENSMRVTANEVNENLKWEEFEENLELGETQKKLYDHIIDFMPGNWVTQVQKALLDPRLVDPEILERAGVLGKVSYRDSCKYQKLEELLTGNDGPVARGDKFVIFSVLREGVTQQENEKLKRRYKKLEIPEEYSKLHLEKSLDVILEEALSKKFGREFNIGILDGGITNIEARESLSEKLKDNLDGLIATIQTGGESQSFVHANWMYLLDKTYVPDDIDQAIWRELRPGQKKKVHITHLVVDELFEEKLTDFNNKKRQKNSIAMDGHDLTEEEWAFVSNEEGFAESIKRGLGGKSINVYEAEINSLNDFGVKVRISKEGNGHNNSFEYYTTDAQKIMQMIGQDPINCWQNPEFVELYMKVLPNLAVPVIHRAKIVDLVKRAKSGNVKFPRSILSDGAGPSLLYEAYQGLKPFVVEAGYKIPKIVDRDTSQLMLDKGMNPNQVLGSMTGKDSPFRKGQFDMVDNESITLLPNWDEVKSTILESHRVLRNEGLLELVVKNVKVSDSFYSGMEKLGFEVLSRKNQGFIVNKPFITRLKNQNGERFSDSYVSKLSSTYLLLARKIDNPTEVDAKDLWFERIRHDSVDGLIAGEENIKEVLEVNTLYKKDSSKMKKKKSVQKDVGEKLKTDESSFEPERKIIIDNQGVVQIVKKIGGEGI